MQTDLFKSPVPERGVAASHPSFELSERLWELADRGVRFGTSSWKYDSWKGVIYCDEYTSKKDFDHRCIHEYSQIFPSVSGDFSFYNWPSEKVVADIVSQTREGFEIALKATDLVTLKTFPNVPRWGTKGGKVNPDFLNANLFAEEFCERIEPLRLARKLAPIVFEFTDFQKHSFTGWPEFADALKRFATALRENAARDLSYGVELRTRDFFHEGYLTLLKDIGFIPVLNSWTRMPPLNEQWKLARPIGFDTVMVRAVMRPGRTRDEAVELFEPYDRHKETYAPGRQALLEIAQWAIESGKKAYLLVNNHMEGCSHITIDQISRSIEK